MVNGRCAAGPPVASVRSRAVGAGGDWSGGGDTSTSAEVTALAHCDTPITRRQPEAEPAPQPSGAAYPRSSTVASPAGPKHTESGSPVAAQSTGPKTAVLTKRVAPSVQVTEVTAHHVLSVIVTGSRIG